MFKESCFQKMEFLIKDKCALGYLEEKTKSVRIKHIRKWNHHTIFINIQHHKMM